LKFKKKILKALHIFPRLQIPGWQKAKKVLSSTFWVKCAGQEVSVILLGTNYAMLLAVHYKSKSILDHQKTRCGIKRERRRFYSNSVELEFGVLK
jgi:hypothetical protein